MRFGRQLSQQSRRDFLLDAVQALRRLRLYFFTLRSVRWGVNESAGDCEQAVIPVADTPLWANKWRMLVSASDRKFAAT
jgi:hypothetical protein